MKSTITAVFESLDLAEVAARKLRQTYPQIHDIKIKYNSVNIHDEGNDFFPVITGAYGVNAVQTPTGYFPYAFNSVINDVSSKNQSESSFSTKSKIIIKVDNSIKKAVSSTLTSMGGLQVNSFDFALK